MSDSDFALLLSRLDLTTPRVETRGAMLCIFASWPAPANDHYFAVDQTE